jgi:hypothetical protein
VPCAGTRQGVKCAGQPGCPGELGLRSLAATRSGLIFIPGGAAQRHVDSSENADLEEVKPGVRLYSLEQ